MSKRVVMGCVMCLVWSVSSGCQEASVGAQGGSSVLEEGFEVEGAKSDAIMSLEDYPGRLLDMGEAASGSFEGGLAWGVFELARGASIELSFGASTHEAYIYGPLPHRASDPPRPGEFFDASSSRFVRGWRQPSREVLSVSQGGHYLLIMVARGGAQKTFELSSRCLRRCASRQELAEGLRAVLPPVRTLLLPARGDLAAIPFDPNNPLNGAKVELGRLLFHSPHLATRPKKEMGHGTYSCASCHNLNHGSGAGAPQGIGEGGEGGVFRQDGWSSRLIDRRYEPAEIDAQPIASPTILNSAYLTSALWNGALGLGDVQVPGGGRLQNSNREYAHQWKQGTPPYWSKLGFSGLETQAIIGMHVHRQSILGSALEQDEEVRALFERAFPDEEVDRLRQIEDCYHALRGVTFPETYFSAEPVAGEARPDVAQIECDGELAQSPYRESVVSDLKASLAMAAYERTLLATNAPFQQWLRDVAEGDAWRSHALTLDELRGGRVFFDARSGNCVSCHFGPSLSDGDFHVMGLADLLESDRARIHTKLFEGEEKGRGGWTGREDLLYAFKTPQLYNLSQKSFYGHGSTHRTLESMVRYMARGEKMVGFIGGDRPLAEDFVDRELSETQILDLMSFMERGLLDESLVDELPEASSRSCMISADEVSRREQGCAAD